MLADIEKFIYNDKIYSKCSASDKEMIDTCIKGFGIEYRNTTFYRQKDGSIGVKCGCFSGTLEEFREQVKNTREGKIAKEYLMIADLMEYHFEKEEGKGDNE